MHTVKQAKYLEDYKILLTFEDRSKKIVDFQKALNGFKGQIFRPLRDKEYFKTFTVYLDTVTWPNEADVSPDYLYEIGE
jgi:ABC-type uncharacterized transport system substrate-binding protein